MELKPPTKYVSDKRKTLFLAGSINMGKTVDWQKDLSNRLLKEFTDLWIFNPRRDDWDNSWEQDIKNEKFSEQVNWEIEHIDKATYLFFYFDKEHMSPISLYELGYVAKAKYLSPIVYCPKEYIRHGNIQIYASRDHFRLFTNYEEAVAELTNQIKKHKE